MATGIPKTQGNGNFLAKVSHNYLPNNLDISLSYEGKQDESDILAIGPAQCLLLWTNSRIENEIDNRLYYGDNLPILASLLNDSSIQGQVKLIYIDPPFATKSIFQSRSQADAYADLLSGSHYIEFIRQRLIFLRELLADDGSIYLHLDENMAFYIKVIMDEVFGKRNFRNWITRKKCNPKNYTKKVYGNISDFILFYTKSDHYIWNRPLDAWTDERAIKEYEYIEKETGRRYKKVPIHAPGTRNGETGKPWRGINPPPGKHWQFPPKTLDEMDARGEIYWSANGNPRRKIYLDESLGIPVQDIWLDLRDAHNQNIKVTGYPTEKNSDLLKRIIEASSHYGDLVLDCFSGSGTTLEVASRLGRRWVGVDNSLEAIATILRRFAKGSEPMGDFVNKIQSEKKNELEKDSHQLSLFAWENDSHTLELEGKKPPIINHFSFYSIASEARDLDGILTQWKEWI